MYEVALGSRLNTGQKGLDGAVSIHTGNHGEQGGKRHALSGSLPTG